MEEENEFLEVKFKEGGFIEQVQWVEGNKVYYVENDKLKVEDREVRQRKPWVKPPKPKE